MRGNEHENETTITAAEAAARSSSTACIAVAVRMTRSGNRLTHLLSFRCCKQHVSARLSLTGTITTAAVHARRIHDLSAAGTVPVWLVQRQWSSLCFAVHAWVRNGGGCCDTQTLRAAASERQAFVQLAPCLSPSSASASVTAPVSAAGVAYHLPVSV